MSIGRITMPWLAVLVGLTYVGSAPAAGLDALTQDGLYTWRVAATDDAPHLCCLRWVGHSPVDTACDLDRRDMNFGTIGDGAAGGEVQMYVTVASGRVERIRVLGLQCPVKSRETIVDLGVIDADESVAWLKPHVEEDARRKGSDALAAIAMHRGPAALRYLEELAASATTDLRKDAIFWMGQVRISETARTLERLMFDDDSAEIREHAAFSMSQSTHPRRAALLVRQGREDPDSDVRGQAWFWLAQTGEPGSEDAILRAVRDERDDDVREEAVSALAQLPDGRDVDALLDVLRDRRLSREVREQALFWLAQSESERAFEYIDRLLSGR